MKKIPTLFERDYLDDHTARAKPIVTPGMEWVLEGEGVATVKYDGACCAIIGGEFYKRYDAKHGKPVPPGAIKCQEEADPITGHLPCWVKCDRFNPADKWFWAAYDAYVSTLPQYPCDSLDGTYEAIGKHFQRNPYSISWDLLVPHGEYVVLLTDRSFEGIREYLQEHHFEGLVFWKNGKPQCKIKRTDFGFEWNGKH
jgi:hypothetical protein